MPTLPDQAPISRAAQLQRPSTPPNSRYLKVHLKPHPPTPRSHPASHANLNSRCSPSSSSRIARAKPVSRNGTPPTATSKRSSSRVKSIASSPRVIRNINPTLSSSATTRSCTDDTPACSSVPVSIPTITSLRISRPFISSSRCWMPFSETSASWIWSSTFTRFMRSWMRSS